MERDWDTFNTLNAKGEINSLRFIVEARRNEQITLRRDPSFPHGPSRWDERGILNESNKSNKKVLGRQGIKEFNEELEE